ncbi:glycerol-3-phosphate 1-O-acyltransferase PlsY [Streptococcus sp. zg-86]|uniref:Glycerol-3-phosphate acyltransferase n=1 Tax=Streptococcus zhangguiae TaxID=2664091 RepID=A0A6I4RGR1_9STRE|nr:MULTISPECIES: glycerol-3-phosphate 1-O-acyltransferase PlsY [unclassified Streptococcus]MTB64683.1 glycerol-3-phosphate 1-O-acyltransferase PlsY [Streptococcus sp. zg-86]MTB90993.1 glycerol-3-phosphate 1-O-acyltransferase PlsY [Streptococcus sp. zg-36]MWV56584.1 glycerol-3-phosphate 1-O-acyltransferase PlsY [Streptococcus sp. zg-70]QTH48545.1 glycerol-3-phosphate 1-O-acyltransferase PlsY [Streptococcus sp. zg-86]
MMKTIVLLLIAYLLGSIPSGLWIGQIFFHKNIREYGSGNIGTTNTFRVLGKQAGISVFIVDFLKGTLAVLLPILLHAEGVSPVIFGLVAVLGHTFPLFAQFKGGKAVATSAGMLMGFAPLFCLYLILVFAVTLYLTSMVSLSSVIGALLGMVGALLFPSIGFLIPSYDLVFTLVILFLGSFVIVRHKENIERILKKEENLVPWGLNLTKQNQKI